MKPQASQRQAEEFRLFRVGGGWWYPSLAASLPAAGESNHRCGATRGTQNKESMANKGPQRLQTVTWTSKLCARFDMNISNLFGWHILCSYSYICHNTLRILRLDMWHPTSVQEVEKYRVRLCSRTDPQASWHSQPTFRGTGDPHRICAERDAWIWRAAGGVFWGG